MNPLLLVDYYKTEHHRMMPPGTVRIYSNGTCRKSRIAGVDYVVVFGLQHFIKKYLMKKFKKDFFDRPKEEVIKEYKRHINVDTTHIEKLHDLGYLPVHIKALPEGSLCPIGVPMFTITNTNPEFAWLVNYLETLISCCIWQAYTSATIANEYRKLLNKYALETTGSIDFVQWQGHDFAMRGMSSPESAILSGMGHLLNFHGTDTIAAIYELEDMYSGKGLIGASVPATEHSVMCMGTKEGEVETFRRLLDLYKTGILSVVSDTWNLWDVLTKFLPILKEEILARDGKLVIRPDSGDPVKILTGWLDTEVTVEHGVDRRISSYKCNDTGKHISIAEKKGVIQLLWETFGGKTNDKGYKELDAHIGAIYGDSITLERAREICERLKSNGFASTNVVLGIGSFTYQYNTRDTFGFAMKATFGEVEESVLAGFDEDVLVKPRVVGREIFKNPITDDGTKKSAKGLLQVYETSTGYKLKDQCTWDEEAKGALQTVFINGQLIRETTLEDIRKRLIG